MEEEMDNISGLKRTNYCNELNLKDVGKSYLDGVGTKSEKFGWIDFC